MILECGDFNAHLGAESARYTYHDKTNSNGRLLLEHATECNLHIRNTMFEKKKGKLWTFISDMNGRKSQIDFILINKKWKNPVHNCEGYSSFSSLVSDHRLVSAKVQLSLQMSKCPPRKKNFDWSALRNAELQQLYTITVRNRFNELFNESDTITEQYGNFIEANAEAADKLIPLKKKAKRNKMANNPRVIQARKAVQNVRAR